MWDYNDPKASKAILLTETKSKIIKTTDGNRGRLTYYSDWVGRMALVLMNEGHRLRNPDTKVSC